MAEPPLWFTDDLQLYTVTVKCIPSVNLLWFLCILSHTFKVGMLTKHLPLKFNLCFLSLFSRVCWDEPSNFSKYVSLLDKTFTLWSWGGKKMEGWGRLRETKKVSHCAEQGGGKKARESSLEWGKKKRRRRQQHLCRNFKHPLKGKMGFHLGFSGSVNSRVLFWKRVSVCACRFRRGMLFRGWRTVS